MSTKERMDPRYHQNPATLSKSEKDVLIFDKVYGGPRVCPLYGGEVSDRLDNTHTADAPHVDSQVRQAEMGSEAEGTCGYGGTSGGRTEPTSATNVQPYCSEEQSFATTFSSSSSSSGAESSAAVLQALGNSRMLPLVEEEEVRAMALSLEKSLAVSAKKHSEITYRDYLDAMAMGEEAFRGVLQRSQRQSGGRGSSSPFFSTVSPHSIQEANRFIHSSILLTTPPPPLTVQETDDTNTIINSDERRSNGSTMASARQQGVTRGDGAAAAAVVDAELRARSVASALLSLMPGVDLNPSSSSSLSTAAAAAAAFASKNPFAIFLENVAREAWGSSSSGSGDAAANDTTSDTILIADTDLTSTTSYDNNGIHNSPRVHVQHNEGEEDASDTPQILFFRSDDKESTSRRRRGGIGGERGGRVEEEEERSVLQREEERDRLGRRNNRRVAATTVRATQGDLSSAVLGLIRRSAAEALVRPPTHYDEVGGVSSLAGASPSSPSRAAAAAACPSSVSSSPSPASSAGNANNIDSGNSDSLPQTQHAQRRRAGNYLRTVLSNFSHPDRPAALAVLELQAMASESAVVAAAASVGAGARPGEGNTFSSSAFASAATSLLNGILNGTSPFSPFIVPPTTSEMHRTRASSDSSNGAVTTVMPSSQQHPTARRTLLRFPSSKTSLVSRSSTLESDTPNSFHPPHLSSSLSPDASSSLPSSSASPSSPSSALPSSSSVHVPTQEELSEILVPTTHNAPLTQQQHEVTTFRGHDQHRQEDAHRRRGVEVEAQHSSSLGIEASSTDDADNSRVHVDAQATEADMDLLGASFSLSVARAASSNTRKDIGPTIGMDADGDNLLAVPRVFGMVFGGPRVVLLGDGGVVGNSSQKHSGGSSARTTTTKGQIIHNIKRNSRRRAGVSVRETNSITAAALTPNTHAEARRGGGNPQRERRATNNNESSEEDTNGNPSAPHLPSSPLPVGAQSLNASSGVAVTTTTTTTVVEQANVNANASDEAEGLRRNTDDGREQNVAAARSAKTGGRGDGVGYFTTTLSNYYTDGLPGVVPDPRNINDTFYKTKDLAMFERGYASPQTLAQGLMSLAAASAVRGDEDGDKERVTPSSSSSSSSSSFSSSLPVLVAADKSTHSSSSSSSVHAGQKVFSVIDLMGGGRGSGAAKESIVEGATDGGRADSSSISSAQNGVPKCISRSTTRLFDFVEAIPDPRERNLYALVDPNRPLRPFFDIDASEWPIVIIGQQQVPKEVNIASSISDAHSSSAVTTTVAATQLDTRDLTKKNNKMLLINRLLIEPLVRASAATASSNPALVASDGRTDLVAETRARPRSNVNESEALLSVPTWRGIGRRGEGGLNAPPLQSNASESKSSAGDLFTMAQLTAEVIAWLINAVLTQSLKAYFESSYDSAEKRRSSHRGEGGEQYGSPSSPVEVSLRPTILTSSTVVESTYQQQQQLKEREPEIDNLLQDQVLPIGPSSSSTLSAPSSCCLKLSLHCHYEIAARSNCSKTENVTSGLISKASHCSEVHKSEEELFFVNIEEHKHFVTEFLPISFVSENTQVVASVLLGKIRAALSSSCRGLLLSSNSSSEEGEERVSAWERALISWWSDERTRPNVFGDDTNTAAAPPSSLILSDSALSYTRCATTDRLLEEALMAIVSMLLEETLDKSIYTRWRPFRLPFQTKRVANGAASNAWADARWEVAADAYAEAVDTASKEKGNRRLRRSSSSSTNRAIIIEEQFKSTKATKPMLHPALNILASTISPPPLLLLHQSETQQRTLPPISNTSARAAAATTATGTSTTSADSAADLSFLYQHRFLLPLCPSSVTDLRFAPLKADLLLCAHEPTTSPAEEKGGGKENTNNFMFGWRDEVNKALEAGLIHVYCLQPTAAQQPPTRLMDSARPSLFENQSKKGKRSSSASIIAASATKSILERAQRRIRNSLLAIGRVRYYNLCQRVVDLFASRFGPNAMALSPLGMSCTNITTTTTNSNTSTDVASDPLLSERKPHSSSLSLSTCSFASSSGAKRYIFLSPQQQQESGRKRASGADNDNKNVAVLSSPSSEKSALSSTVAAAASSEGIYLLGLQRQFQFVMEQLAKMLTTTSEETGGCGGKAETFAAAATFSRARTLRNRHPFDLLMPSSSSIPIPIPIHHPLISEFERLRKFSSSVESLLETLSYNDKVDDPSYNCGGNIAQNENGLAEQEEDSPTTIALQSDKDEDDAFTYDDSIRSNNARKRIDNVTSDRQRTDQNQGLPPHDDERDYDVKSSLLSSHTAPRDEDESAVLDCGAWCLFDARQERESERDLRRRGFLLRRCSNSRGRGGNKAKKRQMLVVADGRRQQNGNGEQNDDDDNGGDDHMYDEQEGDLEAWLLAETLSPSDLVSDDEDEDEEERQSFFLSKNTNNSNNKSKEDGLNETFSFDRAKKRRARRVATFLSGLLSLINEKGHFLSSSPRGSTSHSILTSRRLLLPNAKDARVGKVAGLSCGANNAGETAAVLSPQRSGGGSSGPKITTHTTTNVRTLHRNQSTSRNSIAYRLYNPFSMPSSLLGELNETLDQYAEKLRAREKKQGQRTADSRDNKSEGALSKQHDADFMEDEEGDGHRQHMMGRKRFRESDDGALRRGEEEELAAIAIEEEEEEEIADEGLATLLQLFDVVSPLVLPIRHRRHRGGSNDNDDGNNTSMTLSSTLDAAATQAHNREEGEEAAPSSCNNPDGDDDHDANTNTLMLRSGGDADDDNDNEEVRPTLAHSVPARGEGRQRVSIEEPRDGENKLKARRVERTSSGEAQAISTAASTAAIFSPIPPIPPSRRRIVILNGHIRALLSEVFRCLHPAYDNHPSMGAAVINGGRGASALFLGGGFEPIMPYSLSTCQYEDNSCFRSYYVYQKRNKFCLRLGRAHKQTYGQLFLTYNSIKFRCYSNDCHECCHTMSWDDESDMRVITPHAAAAPAGAAHGQAVAHTTSYYPKYSRLRQLRELLFPQLSENELGSRYPWVCGPADL